MLALSAALLFLVLRLTGAVTVVGFVGNPGGVESLAHPALRGVLLSACGALARTVMLTTYRQYLLPGALIALRAIESAALVGRRWSPANPGWSTERWWWDSSKPSCTVGSRWLPVLEGARED